MTRKCRLQPASALPYALCRQKAARVPERTIGGAFDFAKSIPISCSNVVLQRAALMARRRTTEADIDDLPRYFVWVRGLEGPEPQKWTAMDFGIGDWKRPLVLAFLELPEGERHLPLSALARRYPPPRVETL